jgi:SAM-dependent methyltransferase
LPGIAAADIVRGSSNVLDVGCGSGINTFLISQAADGVTVGADPVQEQINSAKSKFNKENLQYICSDYIGITDTVPCKFDLVTFFGSLDYIPLDTEFFITLNALTCGRARCYISKFHPIWTTLFANDVEAETENTYFDIARKDLVKFGNSNFLRYHYSLAEILSRFDNNNWHLKRLIEPKPDFSKSAFAYLGYDNDPTLSSRLQRFPMSLVLEFEKGK